MNDLKIELKSLEKFRKDFELSDKNIVAMNAASNGALYQIALNAKVRAQSMNRVFSNEIKTRGITNQKKSGRCWMFAGLNLLRESVADKLNLESFELSQSYQMFWDKLEKANYFLENIIETANEDLHGRLVMWLLSKPVEDGGQWGMFVDLVEKYGIMPKDIMDESFQTGESATMNMILYTKLREDAMVLREMSKNKKNSKEIQKRKEEMLEEVYRILVINIGLPPDKFDYEYKDKDGNFQRIEGITPLEFYKNFSGIDLGDMVSIINCPTPDKEFMKTYTVKYLGNVIGGRGIIYLNVDMKDFKALAINSILKDQPVWFTSDVGKMMEREKGILDTKIYDFESLYSTKFIFNKAQRLDYGNSLMTHAMVFTGVDINNDNPSKWKVENSWGDQIGDKGYFTMSDSWFDEYVYEIAVNQKFLSSEMKKALKQKPVVLEPWDPMGSVAWAR